jgi:feruloyl-CoA synthase
MSEALERSPAPYREAELPSVDLVVERRADGVVILTPREPLRVEVATVPLGLARQAELRPDKTHLAERAGANGAWRRQNFAEAKAASDAMAQWLLARGLEGRPVLIASGNSIAHATVRNGAMAAGAPVCPVSANYALMGAVGGYERLRHVVDLVKPAVIFAETAACAPALAAVAPQTPVISREPEAFGARGVGYDAVVATPVTDAVAAAIEGLRGDAPAAYMLTSGSTGRPKAVIQTHAMLTANLFQGWQTLGRASGWHEVMLDWLPWSHVSGAFGLMAAAVFGGTLHIDGGKPLPGLFDETIRNLKEIPLPYFANVPSGYAMLADALETDADLRRTFFRDLRLMLYGGAGLPQPLYDRLQALAVQTCGRKILFTTGYGATETSSGCMAIYFPTERVGIGLPMPGLSVKLVPLGDRYELRMKGPMVTPGYLDAPDVNATIRDEEGFYRIGDTARFHNADDPAEGLAFAGRLAEEFKLNNGTWVSAGALRMQLLAAMDPLAADLLVCGEGHDAIGILAWPRAGGTPALDQVRARLEAHNAANGSSSTRVERFAWLAEPPNVEAHEISDKGAVNQALARRRRAADVARLYDDPPPAAVLAI